MEENNALEGKIERATADESTAMMMNALGISLLRLGGEIAIGPEDFRRMETEGPFSILMTDGEAPGTLRLRLSPCLVRVDPESLEG